MVLAYPQQTKSRTQYVESYPDQSVQIWWHDVSMIASSFFYIVQQPESMLYEQPLTVLISELQEAHDRIVQMPAPSQVHHLRKCLLAALNDLITGYKEFLIKEDSFARAYVESALLELQFVQLELQELRNNYLVA